MLRNFFVEVLYWWSIQLLLTLLYKFNSKEIDRERLTEREREYEREGENEKEEIKIIYCFFGLMVLIFMHYTIYVNTNPYIYNQR